ncbi:MAG: zf-HC2 domain-containing protein, partial [Bryobacteraceae bacterium]
MEHQHAVESQAVERYLLGELSSGDREAFEEHFFTCTECAAEVRAGAIFADNAKSVFADEDRKRLSASERRTAGSKGWFVWFRPVFAMPLFAVLLITSAYQAFILVPSLQNELARSRTARWVPAAVLYSEVRGEEPVVRVPEGAES